MGSFQQRLERSLNFMDKLIHMCKVEKIDNIEKNCTLREFIFPSTEQTAEEIKKIVAKMHMDIHYLIETQSNVEKLEKVCVLSTQLVKV